VPGNLKKERRKRESQWKRRAYLEGAKRFSWGTREKLMNK